MKRYRPLVALALLFLITTLQCNREEQEQNQPIVRFKAKHNPKIDALMDSGVLHCDPADMTHALHDSYRIKPDARFVLAMGKIYRFYSGKETLPSTTFVNDQWNFSIENSTIGSLRSYADFSEAIDLMQSWILRLAVKYPVSVSTANAEQGDIDTNVSTSNLINRLEKDEAEWKRTKTIAALTGAARAMAILAFESEDKLEIGDDLAAQAMALITIARHLSSEKLIEEEALLSYSMGYTKHAETLASKLNPENPVHRFLSENPIVTSLQSPNELATVLHLSAIARMNDLQLWEKEARKISGNASNSLAILRTAMDIEWTREWEDAGPSKFASAIPSIVTAELHHTTSTGLNAVSSSTELESALSERFAADDTPFGVAKAAKAFYRSMFYSAYYVMNSVVPGPSHDPYASDYNQWQRDHETIEFAKGTLPAFLADLQGLPMLGGGPLIHIGISYIDYMNWDNPQIAGLMRLLVKRADSRIRHRMDLGKLFLYPIQDRNITGRLYESSASQVSNVNLDILSKSAIFQGDIQKLIEILQSPSCSPQCATNLMMEWSGSDHLHNDQIEKSYDEAIRRYPTSWTIVDQYISFLRQQTKYDKATDVVQKWIDRNNDPEKIGYVHSRIRQATNYYFAGKYEKGLQVLEPVHDEPIALKEYALLYGANGQFREAEEKGKQSIDEESSNPKDTALFLAIVYWREKKYQEAATVLAEHYYPTFNAWDDPGPAFFKAFSDRTLEEKLAAIDAMKMQHISAMNLTYFSRYYASVKDYQTAFELSKRIEPGASAEMAIIINSYSYLKKWKGKEEAAKWLKALIPPNRRNPMCMKGYYTREYDLLWDFIETPDPNDHPDWVWVFRAFASAKIGQNDPHRQELIRHFSSRPTDMYFAIARYLLALSTEKEILSFVTSPIARCDFAYAMGLKAETERRYEDATDWYRVAIDTAQREESEYALSLRALSDWPYMGYWAIAEKEKLKEGQEN